MKKSNEAKMKKVSKNQGKYSDMLQTHSQSKMR